MDFGTDQRLDQGSSFKTRLPESKSQQRDWDYEFCSLSDMTETLNLIVSVPRQRLRPRITLSRLRPRSRPRLNANNLWCFMAKSKALNENQSLGTDLRSKIELIIHIITVNLRDSKPLRLKSFLQIHPCGSFHWLMNMISLIE